MENVITYYATMARESHKVSNYYKHTKEMLEEKVKDIKKGTIDAEELIE